MMQEVMIVANFIPKQYKKDAITIRLPQDKLETIDRIAAEYDMSRNEFINQCIAFALRHMAPPESE